MLMQSQAAELLPPTALLAPALLAILLSLPAFADYQAGLDAYNAARYTTALDEWTAVVEQAPSDVNPAIYAEAHYAIGMLYWLGLGVPKDYPEAAKWLRKAAEMGSAGAQAKLGYLYTEGIAVARDYPQAFQWFSKAAKQGDIDGQYNLGIFYLNGWGTAQDNTMAAQYLGAASAQGDEAAETALRYLLGPGSSLGRQSPTPSGTGPAPTLLAKKWILAQNPDRYTIQVIDLSTKAALEELVEAHADLSPLATYTVQQNNKPLYLLILGTYRSLDAARAARDQIPGSIQKPGRFWIRTFREIQILLENED